MKPLQMLADAARGAAIGLVIAALVLVLLSVVGCAAPASFLAAERATYNAVAPEYLDYVNADPKLDAAQKQSRRDTIQAWDAGLRAWESGDDQDNAGGK